MKKFFSIIITTILFISCSNEKLNDNVNNTDNSTNNCLDCNCENFESSNFELTLTNKNLFVDVFSNENFAIYGKYMGFSDSICSRGQISIYYDDFWKDENSSFSEKILTIDNALASFDFSFFESESKQITFDINTELNDIKFLIDGERYDTVNENVQVISTKLQKGFNIIILGKFDVFQIGGTNIGIDNICVKPYGFECGVKNGVCESFQDTTFYKSCSRFQNIYSEAFYIKNIGYRYKYVDHTGYFSDNEGSIFVENMFVWTGGEILNKNEQSLVVNNVDLELDFTKLNYEKSHVEFDVYTDHNLNFFKNEYKVNGFDLNNLPEGISYEIKNNHDNDGIPYKIVIIEGKIKSIVLKGWETRYDNLCIKEI